MGLWCFQNGSPAIKGMGMPLPTAGPPIMPIQPGGALPPLPPTPMPTMPPNIPPMVPPMSQAPGIPTQVIPPNFPPMVPPYTQAPGIPTQMASAVAAVPPAVPLMSAVPPTVPQMAAAIPPSTLSGLISSQTSPPSGPTPPTPPIVAPIMERERIGSFDSQ